MFLLLAESAGLVEMQDEGASVNVSCFFPKRLQKYSESKRQRVGLGS